ncbi:hypothetical protein [Tannerella forsythia]
MQVTESSVANSGIWTKEAPHVSFNDKTSLETNEYRVCMAAFSCHPFYQLKKNRFAATFRLFFPSMEVETFLQKYKKEIILPHFSVEIIAYNVVN